MVKEATAGHGADVILDMVGGDYIERDLRAAALDGRIVQIAFLEGLQGRGRSDAADDAAPDADRLDACAPRASKPRRRMARGIEEKIWPLIADGKFKPVIDSTFALTDAAAAHARIDDPDHIGKIVLVVES